MYIRSKENPEVNKPVLGAVYCENGYGCARCGAHKDTNILTNFVHDWGCWGFRTAAFNVKVRLTAPEWFAA